MKTITVGLYADGSVSITTIVSEESYRTLKSIAERLNDERREKWDPSITVEVLEN